MLKNIYIIGFYIIHRIWSRQYQITVCCVCIAGHQPVECVQNMIWWRSNLVQGPIWSLGCVGSFYVLVYLTHPSLYTRFMIYFQGGQPPPAPTPPPLMCLRAGYSAHLGVICLRPSIPMPPATILLLAVHDPPL